MTDIQTQKSLAVAELNPIITDIAAFEGTIEGIDVEDEETQAQVGDLVKLLTNRRAKLEDKRKSLVQPLNTVVKDINALFKPPRDRIDNIIQIAKRKMSAFAQAQLAIEREKKRQAEEEARREREEAQKLARELAEKAGTTGAEVAQELEAQAEEKVEKAEKKEAKVAVARGSQASVIVTKTWEAQVTDIIALAAAVAAGRLPPEVIEPNMRALKAISRETKLEREVDGVRFFEKISTGVR